MKTHEFVPAVQDCAQIPDQLPPELPGGYGDLMHTENAPH